MNKDLYIVDSCPLTKLSGCLSKLHSADDDAVAWLTNYGGPQRTHTTTTTNTWLRFRVKRSRGKMFIGHGRLCVCLSVSCRIPTLLHGPGCSLAWLAEWSAVPSSYALLGGFAIGARVSLL